MSAAPASPLDHVQTSVDGLLESFDAGSGMRTAAIAALQKLCDTIGYDVIPFGSHTIGTALPGSDVDVTIRTATTRPTPSATTTAKTSTPKSAATKAMRKAGLAADANAKDLSAVSKALLLVKDHSFAHIRFVNATVPLITCRFKGAVDIDIAFRTTGVETSTLLRNVLTPDAIKLVRLFKFLLQRWQLNDSHRGGIGSLVASLMVLHFLQERSSAMHGRPIGAQFVGFLDFWVHFDYRSKAIRFRPTGVSICESKPESADLVIMHPIDTSRNAASGANRFARDILPRMRETLSWLSSASSTSKLNAVRAFGAIEPAANLGNKFGRWWSKHGAGQKVPYVFDVNPETPQTLWTCKLAVNAAMVVVGQASKKKLAKQAVIREIVAMLDTDDKFFTR